ncbi:hypothetical protein SNOG_06720 [Parastagonospora nodorum SN15]|uniref:Uncharacterized protein n=1 Tax=Phaeosphaeria nodorum (strain SN15 / ATCC MYA-4574 / FGSC 10173) TaxID=321614 RepID=Q0UNE4_PHANO|nr:hypothetical protein SNOG_06720 [Parastagonospora nodorum SN15]EAT85371.1 hypothetical protein SNOG_06720 [Parastagonospora nodorum SN15]
MHLLSRVWESIAEPTHAWPRSNSLRHDRSLFELDSIETPIARKSKSIRILRLGRCYLDIGWSPTTKGKRSTRNEVNWLSQKGPGRILELPTNSTVGRVELPCHPVSPELPLNQAPGELPNEASAVYELESPIYEPFEPTDASMDTLGNIYIDMNGYMPEKRDYGYEHAISHALPLAAPHYTLPKIITQDYLETPPGFASANSSHSTSPISPVTPSLESGHGANAQHHIVSPIATTAVSHQSHQFLSDHFQIEEIGYAQYHSGPHFPVPGLSFTSPTAQPFDQHEPSSKDCVYSSLLFSSNDDLAAEDPTQDPPSDQEPVVANLFEVSQDDTWDTSEIYKTDTQEIDPPAYSFRDFLQPFNLTDTCAVPQSSDHSEKSTVPEQDYSYLGDSLQQDTHGFHIYTNDEVRNRELPSTSRSAKRCNICGKEFTGHLSRYGKGNLARHVREKHLVQSVIGKVCRICKNVYNRADATRKHEWKKHRLQDARPNKRRKAW